ncbi:MAG: NAD-dependent epimerase/dehydratase family protein [Gammaproteobacteria bacterium]|nr:NAD-dependent epimerase/dehydratase family protein [Gammaproteobacteria bacterium]
MTVAWVIGGNGLLGTALRRTLPHRCTHLFTPAERFCWHDRSRLNQQLELAVKEFSTLVGTGNKWHIYWAAGIGTMNSTKAELATETQTLSTVLGLIESEPDLVADEGYFAFASSAGAIYAGATDDIITEKTAVAPTTAYAREKLKQEELISAFTRKNSGLTALHARISTLYGPGQTNGKQQGLLAHIARCIIKNQSVHIYVPFDTIRDYITTNDAASLIVASLCSLSDKTGVYTKIIASEKPATIAEIISVFKRIARRRPRIVSSTSKLSSLYTRRIQFRSITVPTNEALSKTSLLIGIAQVMAAERLAFSQTGNLTKP